MKAMLPGGPRHIATHCHLPLRLTHWADADEVSTVIKNASVVSPVFIALHSWMSAVLSVDCLPDGSLPIVASDSFDLNERHLSVANRSVTSLRAKVKILELSADIHSMPHCSRHRRA
jgi:hypothetical protein